ncbi:Pyridine nucleotide-disulfide oxidoreductase family protein [Trichomonas vaginalis G3]|uniref:Pyridine nucleotide-disulphide oxidoreductase family protein n=1 Tax=Trichomonas vaginalis (strain ATCC PRA-98 / G3) TaxID=412133 RepID=A2EP06_TRIV3|nr:diflavin flavoprotein A 2-related family [Trichomonas vaginalis G3]EAY05610.1 Pyridine nucleotide-disulfide oxidoreductase family protein [Trichomonas vaginalis G3]KAI5486850.1 diflavin flavoprotein A 2-related family [Trichomonas vaginalis G3]|eukprot:XP_001317833.1 Pyridine nucleotide-disulphide oxidoreductase family protein [Trichomonas vaginalis G3]
MLKIQQLTEDIYWLGALDPTLAVFDIIMETKYGTTYNAYMIKTPAGAVLVETVKECFFEEYIEKVKSVIGDINNIKYLITNHTEPDHSGSIKKIIEIIPGLTVIGSKTALTYLEDIVNIPFRGHSAEDLKALKFGGKTFEFISCPFLHWPDSMYTWLPEEQALFTCDSFGAHYSPKKSILMSELPPEEEDGYQEALLYYYTAIFGPFKDFVIKGTDKILDLDIKIICLGHGPVLDARVQETIDTYRKWSEPALPHPGIEVVMVYASAYGYTTEMAEEIKNGILDKIPDASVKMYNVNIQNYGGMKADIMNSIATADGVLLGTNTINGDAVPPIWDVALSMNPIVHGGKIVTAFGSYGWSGEGVDNIINRFDKIRCKVVEPIKIKFRMSKKEHKQVREFGRRFADCLESGEVPDRAVPGRVVGAKDWSELNPTGAIVLWRCVICGEIYAGVTPPLVCPACGVGQDLFELYEAEEVTCSSFENLKFVVVGSGAAAVSAIDAIRARNTVASITMLTREKIMPYYRPIIVDALNSEISPENYYLKNEDWYTENNITVKLGTTVKSIDTARKSLTLSDGSTMQYDRLILATGSRPFVPPIGHEGLTGVYVIRTSNDVELLKETCKTAKKAVVIGGGVLGLENASAIKDRGLSVTVVECMPRLMARQLDPEASEILQGFVRDYGVDLRMGQCVVIKGDGKKVTGVQVGDEFISADFVVVNAGVRAESEVAAAAGIECSRGITVNNKMETSAQDVYAAGDCAYMENINQGLWAPALAMGKVAGANAAGDSKTFHFSIEPVNMIAMGTDLFAVGIPPDSPKGYNVISQRDEKEGTAIKLYFKDNRLVYAAGFKCQKQSGFLLKGVRNGHTLQHVLAELF